MKFRPLLSLLIAVVIVPSAFGQTRPFIDLQPQFDNFSDSETVIAGIDCFSITVDATNADGSTPSYQWRHNGIAIPGEINPVYEGPCPAGTTDQGTYTVLVSNPSGSVTSSNAVLTVLVPPAITTPPLDKSAILGSTATFTVKATGTAPLAYQWSADGVALSDGPSGNVGPTGNESIISGSTNATLTISGVQPGDAAGYTVDVSNDAVGYDTVNDPPAALTVLVPPIIDNQPYFGTNGTATTNIVGDDVLLEVDVDPTSTTPLTYQWRHAGTNIPGATGYIYENLSVQASDAGVYSVVVANGVGAAVTSSNATLVVLVPPAIVTQPLDKTAILSSNVTFTVKASGTPPLAYQWLLFGSPLSDGPTGNVGPTGKQSIIAGSTTATLTISNVQPPDAGDYSVVVTNTTSYTATPPTSSNAHLTVLVPPILDNQPYFGVATSTTATNFVNDDIVINVDVDPSSTNQLIPLTYQWRHAGASGTVATNLPGATSSFFEIPSAKVTDAGLYSVVVTNVAGKVTSSNATLVIIVAPTITQDPQNRTVNMGSNATFTVTAIGTPPLYYQWLFNASPIPGATNASLSFSNSTLTFLATNASQDGAYSAIVSNAAGFDQSSNATLTVVAELIPPTISISSPAEGARWSNAVITVTGTALDNVAVAGVSNRINGGTWNLASTVNKWTNWTATVALTPGTNTFTALAVDTSANKSTNATRHIVYVVTDRLALVTNPPAGGTVSGVANGQILEINQGYTATASSNGGGGFVFTNWVRSTNGAGWVTSSVPLLSFVMQSNLLLQANFVDVQKPTVAITNPTAGLRVSNSVVDVKGTAHDNVQVTNVWVSVNGGVLLATQTQNKWTNWVLAAQTLTPGTNFLRAVAADASGNLSSTVTNTVIYVLSDRLVLVTNPPAGGTVSGVANGQFLEINHGYTATASSNGGGGYVFSNWVRSTNGAGGVTSSVPLLSFVMQSNLLLQANFADAQKPTVAITNPIAGLRVSNSVVDVKGTAHDNVQVTNVWVSVNGGVLLATQTQNKWTNWVLAAQTLTPGTNFLRAVAADASGNLSSTVTNTVTYVLSDRLVLVTNPPAGGTVSGVVNGQFLEINHGYTATASSNGGGGYVFSNWVRSTNGAGGVTSSVPLLSFIMQSNLLLQANFADVQKPTLTITAPTSGQRLSNAVVTVRGTASDNARVAAVLYQLNTNNWVVAAGSTNWSAAVGLLQGTNVVRAYAVDTTGNKSLTNSVSFFGSNAFLLNLGFSSAQPLTNGGLRLRLDLSLWLHGRVEASTNLINWVSLTNFFSTNSPMYFTDPAATNLTGRIYRAVVPAP